MASTIQAVLASTPPLLLVQHWLRKIERYPIHLESVSSAGVSQDLRTQLLAVVGLDKRRARKQNPRWQIIGAAPTKNPNIVQCFCGIYPPPDAAFTALCNNRKCKSLLLDASARGKGQTKCHSSHLTTLAPHNRLSSQASNASMHLASSYLHPPRWKIRRGHHPRHRSSNRSSARSAVSSRARATSMPSCDCRWRVRALSLTFSCKLTR